MRRVAFRFVTVRIASSYLRSCRFVTNTPLPLRMARSLAVGCVSFRVGSFRFGSSPVDSIWLVSSHSQNPPVIANDQPITAAGYVSSRLNSRRFQAPRLDSSRIGTRTMSQLRTARPLAAGLRFVSGRFASNRFASNRLNSLPEPCRHCEWPGREPQGYVSFQIGSDRFGLSRFNSDRLASDRLHSIRLNSGRVALRTRPRLRIASPLAGGLRFVSSQVRSFRIESDRIDSS